MVALDFPHQLNSHIVSNSRWELETDANSIHYCGRILQINIKLHTYRLHKLQKITSLNFLSDFNVIRVYLFNCSFCPHSSQGADVSSPVAMLKGLFFSRCGPSRLARLKTRLFLKGNKQPFSCCLLLLLSRFHSVESRTGRSALECIISPLPSPPNWRPLWPDHQPLS